MNNVLLKNELGESVIASVLRYFKYEDNDYIIYSLNEVDELNYIKLYGVNISVNETGEMIATAIDDSVWGSIVNLIKDMVKSKTESCEVDVQDLNVDSVVSVRLVSKRVFKIKEEMAKLLIAEQIQTENLTSEENITTSRSDEENSELIEETENDNQITSFTQENGLDYKEMYEELLEKNNILKAQNEELQLKIANIENILKG